MSLHVERTETALYRCADCANVTAYILHGIGRLPSCCGQMRSDEKTGAILICRGELKPIGIFRYDRAIV